MVNEFWPQQLIVNSALLLYLKDINTHKCYTSIIDNLFATHRKKLKK